MLFSKKFSKTLKLIALGVLASFSIQTASATECEEFRKQISVNEGLTWFDADTAGAAPSQVLGKGAIYRFVVKNCSKSKKCEDVKISDPTLDIEQLVGDGVLNPLEEVIVTQLDSGFENLDQPNRCDTPGIKLNVATETNRIVATNEIETFTDPAYLNCEPPPEIELCTLVTLNPDMISEFSDADALTGDSCDTFPQSIPVGVAGEVDGTYRLKINNTGIETLVNVRINAPDFGLVNEPIPDSCGDLDPGEMCIIDFDEPGFPSLKMMDVCGAPGAVNKIASVDAEGMNSGIPVSDDDPAIVDCVAEPDITLRKEVRLDDGLFVDANTPASGPTGPLGADAEYLLVVENTGTETLVDAVVNDATLGLINVPVPGGPLAPGDTRTITSGSFGFGALLAVDRCDSVGTHLNTARVDASGEFSGVPVDSEDPAYVNCESPMIELLKEVSLDGVNFFDADLPGAPDVPVGVVGLTNATYRFIVTNNGSEALTNVLIKDTTLGISAFITDLMVGESRVIESGVTGFGNLYVPMRCGGTSGNKSNIASVNAEGVNTMTPVNDDDPANLRCIKGPEIQLLKQVSLDGMSFVDADTAVDGPTGLLGADATYRLIVRNVGDEGLTNIAINDTTLGIVDEPIPDLPVGGEVVIDAGSFGRFNELQFPNRCDAVGTVLNIAAVNASGLATGTPVQDDNPAYVNCDAPLICELSVDQTCSVQTPSPDLLCESAIAATTLRYTGPSINNANVTFEGKKNASVQYTGVDLVSGVTILTMASQNGFTIDSEQLGSKTTITINGVVEEVIHTSCSAIYSAGQPAPLDGNTPNPPNSEKGDPSPNWFVVNFRDKEGGFVEESSGGGTGADACTVPFGGGNVNYAYNIINNGTTNVDVTSVLDDLLGEQLTAPPAQLAPGGSLNLSAGPVFISQNTTSVVSVSANVTGDGTATCPVADSVEVDVEPAPQLPCSEIKPITQLSMVWNGANGVDVLTEGGQFFGDLQNGNQITFNASGLGNDVELTLMGAAGGPSKFHVSCSDQGMNGPEDCGSSQGNGKGDDSGFVNSWKLDAMIGEDGSFVCNVPNTGTVDPSDGGGMDAIRVELKEIKKKELKLNVFNDGGADVTISRVTISWPTSVNGDLKETKAVGAKALDKDVSVSPATFSTWEGNADKRRIDAGKKKEVKFKFENNANSNSESYSVEIEFVSGTIVNL